MKNLKLYEDFGKSKILYLHGLDSQPWADRIDIIKGSGANVVAPHLDYRNTDAVKVALEIMEKGDITHLVGHSMGGLLSFFLSNRYKVPALMFNPAFGSKNAVFVTRDEFKEEPFAEQYAVVGMKDEVIDPQTQLANLKHATIWKEPELVHRIPPNIYQKYYNIFVQEANI